MSRIPEVWKDVFTCTGEPNMIDRDLLEEMLEKANIKSVKSSIDTFPIPWEPPLFTRKCYPKLVKAIFALTAYFNITDPFVRYNACDLYDHFLQEFINNPKIPVGSTYAHRWSIVRVFNCIMLSSKISSRSQVRNIEEFALFIRKFGGISLAQIMRTEIQVLYLVQGKVDQCQIYSNSSLLILSLVYNDPFINGQLLHSKLYVVMDNFYLQRCEIMKSLFKKFWRLKNHDEGEIDRSSANSMLISCGIVAATSIIVGINESRVINELAFITCYPKEDIVAVKESVLTSFLTFSSDNNDIGLSI